MFEQTGPRMGRGDYWISFMACWGLTIFGGIVFAFASFIGSSFFTLLGVLAMLGSSVYIRLAQMQRCNDIGWPWQLPWGVFGISLALSAVSLFHPLLALIMLPLMLIIGLGDFVFGIVLGCMPSKDNNFEFDAQAYRDAYRDYGAPNMSLKLEAQAELRNREAAARVAIENPVISASGKRVASVTRSEEPAAPPPRAMGFGRKGILG